MKIVVGQGSCGLAAGAGKVYDAIAAHPIAVEQNGKLRKVRGRVLKKL